MHKKLSSTLTAFALAAAMLTTSVSAAPITTKTAQTEAQSELSKTDAAKTDVAPTKPAKISFAAKKYTVKVKKKQKIKLLNNKAKVTWRIKNPKIARIVKTKKQQVTIKGLRKGKTKLYAKVGKKTYKCTIAVVKKLPATPAATSTNPPTKVTPAKPSPAKPSPAKQETKPGTTPGQSGTTTGGQSGTVISDGTSGNGNGGSGNSGSGNGNSGSGSGTTTPTIFTPPTTPEITGLVSGKVYHIGDEIQLGLTGATTGTWVSENTSAATVSADGLVKCVGEGTAKITVTINGGSGATAMITVNR